MHEFRSSLNEHFLPRIQSQPGFVDNIESLDPTTGEFCCTTLWNSRSDVEHYDSGLFQEVAAKLAPLMIEGPTIKTLPVENSSTHRVAAGKAA
jgi:heme-degrading monooxygenase HmoA